MEVKQTRWRAKMIITQTVMVSCAEAFRRSGPDFNVSLIPNDSVPAMQELGWIKGPQVTFSMDMEDNELREMIKSKLDKQRTDLICQMYDLDEKIKAFDQEPIKPTPAAAAMYGDDL
jgi:hypothetical protein